MIRSRRGIVVAAVGVTVLAGAIVVLVSRTSDPPSRSPTLDVPLDGDAMHVAAVGDMSDPERPDADLAVAEAIERVEPRIDALLTLGDNQYPEGALDAFGADYHLSFGRFNDVVRPIAGNHEWRTPGAAGYVGYFEEHAAAFPGEQRCTWRGDCAFRYAWALEGWSFYAVDDLHGDPGFDTEWIEATAGWLGRRLEDDPNDCQVVYTHAPRFSDGMHGDAPEIEPIWQAAVAGGVELFLAGHDHSYQRFDVDGVTQVVVGTGGGDLRGFEGDLHPGSRAEISGLDGFALLTLERGDPAGFTVRFVDVDGSVHDTFAGDTCS